MDVFGYESHAKASAAEKAGYFQKEVVSVSGIDKEGAVCLHSTDEGIRHTASIEVRSGTSAVPPTLGVMSEFLVCRACGL